MNKRIIAKVNMFSKLDTVLQENQSIIDTSAAFRTMTDQLHDRLADMEARMRPLMLHTTGIAADKKAAKITLSERLAAVCGGLLAYASVANDHNLYQQADYSYSDLLRMRDTELQETSEALYALAMQNELHLVTYNVTPQTIADLLSAINRFKAGNQMPGLTLIERKTRRGLLYKLVNFQNTILRTQMDKVAMTFAGPHPEFFRLYRNVRRNYSLGVRHQTPHEGGVPTGPTTHAAAALPDNASDLFDNAVKGLVEEVAESNGVLAG